MFADAALAARIDRAEGRLCALFVNSAAPRADGPSQSILPIAGGQAIYAGPASPINKVIGIGFDTPLDPGELEEVERAWAERNEPVRIELSILTDPDIGRTLTGRGYRLHGFENVLGRPLDRPHHDPFPENLTIEVLEGDEDLDTWMDIAVEAFLHLDGTGSVADEGFTRDQLRDAISEYTGVPGMARYLARIDGQAVGEAAMRLDGDLAQLAGAGTLPVFRGRGVQKALLQRRLDDAFAAGARLAVVTTAPGTRSQENVMRRGFALLYSRAILIRPV